MALLEWALSPVVTALENISATDTLAARQFEIDATLAPPNANRVLLLHILYTRNVGGAATGVVIDMRGKPRVDLPWGNFKSGTDSSGVLTLAPTNGSTQIVCPVTATECFCPRLDKILFPYVQFDVSLTGGNANDLVSLWYQMST